MGQRDNHGTQHPVGTGKLDVHRACQKNTSTIRGWQTVIAWCTGKGLIDTSAGSARPMAKGDQLFVNDVNIPANPDRGHFVVSVDFGVDLPRHDNGPSSAYVQVRGRFCVSRLSESNR